MKLTLLVVGVPMFLLLFLGVVHGESPQVKPMTVIKPQCKAIQNGNVISISCTDGWNGEVIIAKYDQAWFTWKTADGKKHSQLMDRAAHDAQLVPIFLQKNCMTQKDICACSALQLRGGELPNWCSKPACDINSDAGQCDTPGPASIDPCGILNHGCDDWFTQATGTSDYFCAGATVFCLKQEPNNLNPPKVNKGIKSE
jgi:hypothetical protein